jgi:hypothetical protein
MSKIWTFLNCFELKIDNYITPACLLILKQRYWIVKCVKKPFIWSKMSILWCEYSRMIFSTNQIQYWWQQCDNEMSACECLMTFVWHGNRIMANIYCQILYKQHWRNTEYLSRENALKPTSEAIHKYKQRQDKWNCFDKRKDIWPYELILLLETRWISGPLLLRYF